MKTVSKYIGTKLEYKGGDIEVVDYKTVSGGARTDHFIVKALDHKQHVRKGGEFSMVRQTLNKLIKKQLGSLTGT